MTVQKRRKYTDEFKQDAVMLVLEQGYKVSEAARNLGINEGMLRRWVKKIAEVDARVPGSSGTLAEARIRELEAENKRLQMEREILKKATAFFAKESN